MFVCLFIFFMLVYFEREREREHTSRGGAERETERERIPSRLHAVSTEPDTGLSLTNCEIMPRAEIRSGVFNCPSHSGAPNVYLFILRESRHEEEMGRQRISGRLSLHPVGTEPNSRLHPTNCEIMT